MTMAYLSAALAALHAVCAVASTELGDTLNLMQSRAERVAGEEDEIDDHQKVGETTATTTFCAAFETQFPDLVKVDFSLSENTINNLGGVGPETGVSQELYYHNVATVNADGHTYDLRVTTIGSYATHASRYNGQNGHYGVVNVETGESVNLKFEFIEPATGMAATLQKVFFSWFDVDQGQFGKSSEQIILWPGYTSTLMSTSTEVEKVSVPCPGAAERNCEAFQSRTHGVGKDNPSDPMTLTEQQAARTFSVLYKDVSAFQVTLAAGVGHGTRNFLFTGLSEVTLASVEQCCPDHICGCKAYCIESGEEWQQKCTWAKCAHCTECETTTTTTTQIPPTPTEVCNDALALEFSPANLVENTLGDNLAGRLLFKNVVTYMGHAVDMSVTDASNDLQYLGKTHSTNFETYTSDNREYTGVYKDAARIAVDRPGDYAFKFAFTDSETGAPVELPMFPLTIFDIDGVGEKIRACHVAGVIGYKDSALKERYFEGCYTHFSKGKEVNLPKDFEVLTHNQKKQSITYVYKDRSEFFIEVLLEKSKNRYVVFKGSKILACDAEASTATAWGPGKGNKEADK